MLVNLIRSKSIQVTPSLYRRSNVLGIIIKSFEMEIILIIILFIFFRSLTLVVYIKKKNYFIFYSISFDF